MTRIHIGSGSVYLDGWVNIDVPGPKTFLAKDRPDLVKKWKTTDGQYYARHADKSIDTLRAGPLDQEYVCDAHGSFDNIPAPYWSVSHVLARQSFEHLSLTEAHKALDQIDGIMEPNGILTLDVPDHEGTLQKFRETGDEFYIRHLLGPRRGDRGYHMMSYSRERLIALVEEHGFVYEREEPNPHFFPAFTLRFKKPGPRAPRDYVAINVTEGARMLDVGPGLLEHPRADVYLDNDPSNVARLRKAGKAVILEDLMTGLPDIPDKAFGFAFCSHVLEHVVDPAQAAASLSRIAKRGTIVMPSAWKEALTNFEERSHLWSVLDNPTPGNPPIFIRATSERLDRLRNTDVMKSLSRVFRTGPNDRVIPEGRVLRKWWYNSEPNLDIVHHWEGQLKLQVIE